MRAVPTSMDNLAAGGDSVGRRRDATDHFSARGFDNLFERLLHVLGLQHLLLVAAEFPMETQHRDPPLIDHFRIDLRSNNPCSGSSSPRPENPRNDPQCWR